MGLRQLIGKLFGSTRDMVQLEGVNGVDGSEDPDEQVRNQLRAAGANLEKATHTLFYIYAATEAGANRIAQAVTDSRLDAEVRPAAVGTGWLCLAQGELVPALDVLKSYRSKFEALAAAEGGEYDGWEAAVTE